MEFMHKVIIIGAGPIGLYFASKCEEKGVDYLVLEGSEEIGGQLTRLYPEKDIVDIPSIPCIKAKDYVELLKSKISPKNVILNAQVQQIKNSDKIQIFAGKTVYFCEFLIIATGLGASVPRPLGVERENECDGLGKP